MSKMRAINKTIESTVVDSYKKVEDTVVSGYKKIEDKFVDTFLKKDDESIEEAKERINKDKQKLTEKNKTTVESSLKLSKEINDKYVK